MAQEAANEDASRLWDLANRFWDLGNYITVFAVGQTVLVSMSLGTSKELKTAILPIRYWVGLIVMVGLFVCRVPRAPDSLT
jgi:hypothetical protein